MTTPIPLIVPGLRDHVVQHWQTWLAERLPNAHSLTPMGRENLSLDARIADLEATIAHLKTHPLRRRFVLWPDAADQAREAVNSVFGSANSPVRLHIA